MARAGRSPSTRPPAARRPASGRRPLTCSAGPAHHRSDSSRRRLRPPASPRRGFQRSRHGGRT